MKGARKKERQRKKKKKNKKKKKKKKKKRERESEINIFTKSILPDARCIVRKIWPVLAHGSFATTQDKSTGA